MSDLSREAELTNQAEDQRPAKLCALEAVLFMAADPLPTAELAEILDVTPQEADDLARQLEADYVGRGLQVARVAGGYHVCTRPEYGSTVAKLHKPERFRLSRAALETLAIVAYKQPVTRPEIEAIRGVNSDSVVDTLTQYELVCEAGRKDAPGRPMLYRTTQNFLGHFGLNSIEDLPQIESIPADEASVQAEVAASLPEDGERQADEALPSAPPQEQWADEELPSPALQEQSADEAPPSAPPQEQSADEELPSPPPQEQSAE